MNNKEVVVLRGYDSADRSAQMQQLAAELWVALRATPGSELTLQAAELPSEFIGALGRRVKNLANLAGSALDEANQFFDAASSGTFIEHLSSRKTNAAIAAAGTYEQITMLGQCLLNNPREQLPRVMLLVGTGLLSSGGLDGDGGVPDTDIPLFGVGAHRSPLTHSFFIGAALEAFAIVLVRSICVVHKNLPAKRHPAWEAFTPKLIEGIETARSGAALGLAYHFMVDGLLQPAPYHGLPIEMPLDVHQAIFVASGVSESMSAGPRCTPDEDEQILSVALLLRLIPAVMSNRKLSPLLKGMFVDHVMTGSCVRAGIAERKVRGVLVGSRLRCSGCNRTKTISIDFYKGQAARLGRSFRHADLPRLVCTGCLMKGGFEVLD